MTLGVLVWSIATFLLRIAPDFWSMLGARALVGVGEASYRRRADARHRRHGVEPRWRRSQQETRGLLPRDPGRLRARVRYLGGFLETKVGWRGAFQFVGAPGVLLALACLLISTRARTGRRRAAKRRRRPPDARAAHEAEALRACRPWLCRADVRARRLIQHWAPSYIEGRHKFDLDRANYVFGAVLVVGGFIGTTLGGAWGERVARGLSRGRGACPRAALPYRLRRRASRSPPGPCAERRHVLRVHLLVHRLRVPFDLAINAAVLEWFLGAPHERNGPERLFDPHVGDLWSPPLVGRIGDSPDDHGDAPFARRDCGLGASYGFAAVGNKRRPSVFCPDVVDRQHLGGLRAYGP